MNIKSIIANIVSNKSYEKRILYLKTSFQYVLAELFERKERTIDRVIGEFIENKDSRLYGREVVNMVINFPKRKQILEEDYKIASEKYKELFEEDYVFDKAHLDLKAFDQF